MKRLLTTIGSTLLLICLGASGPPTNWITLSWNNPTNDVPYTVTIYQGTKPNDPMPWTVLTNVPSTQTSLSIQVSKSPRLFFYAVSVNATNTTWQSDPSNVAQTVWPNQGDLSIRAGQ